jgi:hypothetical protein
MASFVPCRAPSVKQEAQSSDPYKTPPPGRQPSASSSPVKKESPTKKDSPSKKGGPAGQIPVDEMAAKKLKIMTMIFDYAKGLKAEDIAAEVSLLDFNTLFLF